MIRPATATPPPMIVRVDNSQPRNLSNNLIAFVLHSSEEFGSPWVPRRPNLTGFFPCYQFDSFEIPTILSRPAGDTPSNPGNRFGIMTLAASPPTVACARPGNSVPQPDQADGCCRNRALSCPASPGSRVPESPSFVLNLRPLHIDPTGAH